MTPLAARVAAYWRAEGLPPAAGASEETLAAFEGVYGVHLPPDVRGYFAGMNGMAHYLAYEYAAFLVFFPLDQVRPLAEAAPDNAERAWTEAGHPPKELASYFMFADVCYTERVYAARLSGDSAEPSPVVVLDQADYDKPHLSVAAESFAAFIRSYVAGAEPPQKRNTP